MFKTILREGAINSICTYEVRNQSGDLLDLTAYDSVRLYIEGYASTYITATSATAAGIVTITFPSAVMVKGKYGAKFIAVDNTTDMIPLGLVGEIVVLGAWE